MKTATATCENCLNGRHIRCSHRPCACTICSVRRRSVLGGGLKVRQARPGPTRSYRQITDEQIAEARKLLERTPRPSLTEVARRLDVNRSSLHKHLFGTVGGRRNRPVPKLANPKPITPEIITEAARRVAAKDYTSFAQLAYDLGVERTGLYKNLKKRDLLP